MTIVVLRIQSLTYDSTKKQFFWIFFELFLTYFSLSFYFPADLFSAVLHSYLFTKAQHDASTNSSSEGIKG